MLSNQTNARPWQASPKIFISKNVFAKEDWKE
jgi:hypothetical protein